MSSYSINFSNIFYNGKFDRENQPIDSEGAAADIVLLQDGVELPKDSPLRKEFADRVSVLSGGKIAWGGDPEYYHTLYNKERHHFELRVWNKKSSPNFCKTSDRLITRYT